MTPYQLKMARLMLGQSQIKLAVEMGTKDRTIRRNEKGHNACTTPYRLAIECLLRRAGLWDHYRLLYMRKDQTCDFEPKHKRVTKQHQLDMTTED